MGLTFDFEPGDSVGDLLRRNPDVLREHALEVTRELAAKAIGPENLHSVTIEILGDGPDDLRASVRGPDDLVARIEAALAEDA